MGFNFDLNQKDYICAGTYHADLYHAVKGIAAVALRNRTRFEAHALVNAVDSMARCDTQIRPILVEIKRRKRWLGPINRNVAPARF
jgi:hypothetical protein